MRALDALEATGLGSRSLGSGPSVPGAALGTVCVIDREPRTLDPKQLELLQFLAQQVVRTLEQREQKLSDAAR